MTQSVQRARAPFARLTAVGLERFVHRHQLLARGESLARGRVRRRLVGARRRRLSVRRLVGLIVVGGAISLRVKLEGTQRRRGEAKPTLGRRRLGRPSSGPSYTGRTSS